jgi:hypothetical protein
MAKSARKAQRRSTQRQRQRRRRAADNRALGKDRKLAGDRRTEDEAVEEASKESFPASDAPASGLPDKPPVNADEKWKAARKARQRAKRRRGGQTTA